MVVFIIAYLIDGIIFGLITDHVAKSKGYFSGFWWGFWLGLIGLLVVGFRPNLEQAAAAQAAYTPMYGGALKPEEKKTWTCTCGAKNSERLDYCPICQKNRADVVKPDITCPHCGVKNNASRTICVMCDKPLDGSLPEPSAPAVPDAAASAELADLLEKLAALHTQGVLNDDEFNRKKAEMLSRM